MQQSHRQTIDPHYKQGNIFQRDQAYYTQMLTGTRRITNQLQGSVRQSSLQRSRSNQGQSRISPANVPLDNSKHLPKQTRLQNPNPFNTPEYRQALETNQQLKSDLETLVSGSNDFGNSLNVVKLQHYNLSKEQTTRLKQQQSEIHQLQQKLKSNDNKISAFKTAGEQLAQRMHNIQQIDREIYKTLQGSVNRDKELLDKAASALARGEKREEVAKILQQILSS